jgi:tetratricopeptide (TPR) repeat protein
VVTALPVLERGLAVCRTWGFDIWSGWLLANLAFGYLLAGDAAKAIDAAGEAAALEQRVTGFASAATPVLALALGAAGDLRKAIEAADKSIQLGLAASEPRYVAWGQYALAEAQRCVDRQSARARVSYESALARASELGMRPLVAHCHLGLGRAYAGAGDREQARTHLTSALSMYREMEMRHWPKQAESALRDL